ncbi:MAG: hypothetical protein HRT52_12035 [Colwellia sp.]|nr:hypothetical protein [Colwellia sp.]
MKKIFIFIILFFIANTCIAMDVVRYVYSKNYPDPKEKYFLDLLELVLQNTQKEFGGYTIQPIAMEMAQERTSIMLEREEYVDLMWRMTTADLEQRLQAIYVPLLKGLMGYRIFIIRPENQKYFTKDMTLENLKLVPLGQGYDWPDSEILKANNFKVTLGHSNNLLKMLQKKRFDYFPRALHEPWIEIAHIKNLVVEKNIALKYFAPIYFFVNKKNIRLTNRLRKGLTNLVNSGEFEQFFHHHKLISGVIDRAKLHDRKVFDLTNPLISDYTQKLLNDKRLWMTEF